MSWRKEQSDRIDRMCSLEPDVRPISRAETDPWHTWTIPIHEPEMPEGWELCTDEEAGAITARPDLLHPLIINRSDPRAPIGMYIQWAPSKDRG